MVKLTQQEMTDIFDDNHDKYKTLSVTLDDASDGEQQFEVIFFDEETEKTYAFPFMTGYDNERLTEDANPDDVAEVERYEITVVKYRPIN